MRKIHSLAENISFSITQSKEYGCDLFIID